MRIAKRNRAKAEAEKAREDADKFDMDHLEAMGRQVEAELKATGRRAGSLFPPVSVKNSKLWGIRQQRKRPPGSALDLPEIG